MAEKHLENSRDGCTSCTVPDAKNEDTSMKPTLKRCSPPSPIPGPPHKSPRTESLSPTIQTAHADGRSETDKSEISAEKEDKISPSARRKSWRRATITRRSLPALPNPYQALSRDICTSLSQQERLEKLMEASMKLAVERTRSMLQSVPNISLDSFQKQVEHIQNEWSSLAKSTRNESQLPSSVASSSKPAVQRAMEEVQRAISRLQAESESWEELLNKHRSKAEELKRKVEQGQKTGVSLDLTSVAESSQYQCIRSKPNYSDLLCRQQPMLHTMATIMDTRRKVVRELLSVNEHSQLLVKKTSGRLAAEAGFQDLSPSLLRTLMAKPLSTATT
ncbi:kinetochore-associated protein DSN1 homolog [Parambassis ranga]|uniref:Kinetochore-associated protein DSN1 homolog n=1 Tax=Parambassis ranga TaxID=210632 RepID=A0A6P7IL09_9TELE|nr:uncharacterized protein LOC114440563 [Parambassis ranga]